MNFLGFLTKAPRGTVVEGKWVYDAPKTDLMEAYKDWDPEVQAVMRVRIISSMCSSTLYAEYILAGPARDTVVLGGAHHGRCADVRARSGGHHW